MLDQGNFIALQQVQQRSNLRQLFECPSRERKCTGVEKRQRRENKANEIFFFLVFKSPKPLIDETRSRLVVRAQRMENTCQKGTEPPPHHLMGRLDFCYTLPLKYGRDLPVIPIVVQTWTCWNKGHLIRPIPPSIC